MHPLRFAALAACLLPAAAFAATFTVTTSADSGAGSLRQAILDANALPGPDTVVFDLPEGGIATIVLATPLPAVTDPVTLDGATQPGFAGLPLIALDGSSAGPGSIGLDLAAPGAVVRGLTVGGFGFYGIRLSGGGGVVEGCRIGVDPAGIVAHGNGVAGIAVSSANNRIGGPTASERNVIAGQSVGIDIEGAGAGNLVQGNFIGTDAEGAAAIASHLGVLTRAPGTVIAGNLVSGHLGEGIEVHTGADGSILRGNFIGTDATGSRPIPNTGNGVGIAGAHAVLVGGTGPGEGNLISGNFGNAVAILGTGNSVLGNLLGTEASGTQALGNRGAGISLGFDADDNVIGGIAPGEANVVAHNSGAGVLVGFSGGNTVRGNAIFANGGLGIDLLPEDASHGPTPNDAGDIDTGGNELQNFPVLLAVTAVPGETRIQGRFAGGSHTSRPSHGSIYLLDFYADAACTPRPRDFPEARVYLGSAEVEADHGETAAFDVTLPVVLEADDIVTATATDPDGNTSELSARILFDAAPRSGPAAGGEAIALFGTDFLPGATVAVGGVVVSSVVADDTTIAAVSPPLPQGTLADIVLTNSDGSAGTLRFGFLADFLDVPGSHAFHDAVVRVATSAVAAGCGGGAYCVDAPLTRAQAAVLLLKGRDGICDPPPTATGAVFADVAAGSFAADWIEALAAAGVTGGCGGGNYCPQTTVRRDQVAVLLLRALRGSDYSPPACTGIFADVPCPSPLADWIEALAAAGITSGCGGGNYCPLSPVTRGQMAVFIAKTFGLS